MMTIDICLPHVPVGEANAKTSREIWLAHGVGAEGTTANCLKRLQSEGKIKQGRRTLTQPPGFALTYWT